MTQNAPKEICELYKILYPRAIVAIYVKYVTYEKYEISHVNETYEMREIPKEVRVFSGEKN